MFKKLLIVIIVFSFLVIFCSKDKSVTPNTKQDVETIDNPPIELDKNVYGLIENYPLKDPDVSTTVIYIDPENTNSQTTGSVDNPHKTIKDITNFSPYMTIAFKRGTIYESDQGITIEKDGMKFMSYGDSDKRPIIKINGGTHALVGHWQGIKNITIRDLEINSVGGTASITFNPTDKGNNNISIINCELHGGGWGLRAMGINGLYVENTEVYNTRDDGIFARWDENVEILNCYVHNVNTDWKPPHTPESEAGGDALQLDDSDNWHVHHNLFDRSSSGNKFCFIANNPNQRNGIFEYNKLLGPLVDGHSIYIGAGSDLVFRYNFISDCKGFPLYSHGTNLQIYGNVFARFGGPIYISGSGDIFRNTFHDIPVVADGGKLSLESNIFSFVSTDQRDYNVPKFTQANNLYSGATKIRGNSFSGNPDFISLDQDDFRLGPNSDAIDRGAETDMVKDMAGVAIPQGSKPDVGAYEREQQ